MISITVIGKKKKKLTIQRRGTLCLHVIASVREGVDERVGGARGHLQIILGELVGLEISARVGWHHSPCIVPVPVAIAALALGTAGRLDCGI